MNSRFPDVTVFHNLTICGVPLFGERRAFLLIVVGLPMRFPHTVSVLYSVHWNDRLLFVPIWTLISIP